MQRQMHGDRHLQLLKNGGVDLDGSKPRLRLGDGGEAGQEISEQFVRRDRGLGVRRRTL